MKTSHTPAFPSGLQLDRSNVVDGMGTFFGTFGGFDVRMAEEILSRYNAAPDLLEALAGLLAESPNQTPAGEKARAAIRKATGQ